MAARQSNPLQVFLDCRPSYQQYNCHRDQSTSGQPLKHRPSPSTDSESRQFKLKEPHHRKFIHKQKPIPKPKLLRLQYRICQLGVMKREILLPQKIQRGIKGRQQILEVVFDWMMEASALLKMSKNGCYRSIMILLQVCERQPRSLYGGKLINLSCGALSLGGKFQMAQHRFIERVSWVSGRRVTREDIAQSQSVILETLRWRIPIDVGIECQLQQIISKWIQFFALFVRSGVFPRLIGDSWTRESIFDVEVVYITDLLVRKLQDQSLRNGHFRVPVLMSIYMLTSIGVGDVHLDRNFVWPIFQKFIRNHGMLKEEQLVRLKGEICRIFVELRIIEELGRIPLDFKFEKLTRRRVLQFYIQRIQEIA